jgi:hypothetical protein
MSLIITDNKESRLVFSNIDNDGDMLVYIENKHGQMVGVWINQESIIEVLKHLKNNSNIIS